MQKQWKWFESWLAENVPEVIYDLNDGCSLEQLIEVENETGIPLPQSFKDFYLIHNGQVDEDFFGLFYGVSLLPLNKILEEMRAWNGIIDEEGEVGMKEGFDDFQTSFMPNKLKAKYASKRWLPFAIISDNCYLGLDFEPEIDGIGGQVINFGREEEQKAVLASSFEEFIDWYIRELERGNYLIHSENGNKQFIPKEYKERFFRGYNYLSGPVALRFISLTDEAKLKEALEKL
ncbi:MAG: SMI1/KNR4 family protein [Acidobacteria bacterium]|nr:SMI1/KNR4 family protein [Acidobacteriota bacterium]